MASIASRDTFPVSEWPSHSAGYPFIPQQAGRMVYYGRAQAGTAAWDGNEGEIGYITLDGTPQNLEWKVPVQHRPVRLMLFHEDAGGVPSAANLAVDYLYRDRGLNRWVWFGGGIATDPVYNEGYGETHERSDVHYRLTLEGTEGHLVRVVPYNQYLQERRFGPRQRLT